MWLQLKALIIIPKSLICLNKFIFFWSMEWNEQRYLLIFLALDRFQLLCGHQTLKLNKDILIHKLKMPLTDPLTHQKPLKDCNEMSFFSSYGIRCSLRKGFDYMLSYGGRILYTHNVKYLGLTRDTRLAWAPHIKKHPKTV